VEAEPAGGDGTPAWGLRKGEAGEEGGGGAGVLHRKPRPDAPAGRQLAAGMASGARPPQRHLGHEGRSHPRGERAHVRQPERGVRRYPRLDSSWRTIGASGDLGASFRKVSKSETILSAFFFP